MRTPRDGLPPNGFQNRGISGGVKWVFASSEYTSRRRPGTTGAFRLTDFGLKVLLFDLLCRFMAGHGAKSFSRSWEEP